MNVYDRSGKLVTKDYEKKTANIAENSKAAKARADAMSAQWEQERARREAEKQQEKARKEAEARARKEAAEREKVRKATEEFNRKAQEAARKQQEKQARAEKQMQSQRENGNYMPGVDGGVASPLPKLKMVDGNDMGGFALPDVNTANQGPIALNRIDPSTQNNIIPSNVPEVQPVLRDNAIANETDLDRRIQSYLDAGKLTKEQKKEAKAVLKEELNRRKQLFQSGNTDAMIPGTDEFQRNRNFDDLTAKVNSNFGYGLVSPFAKIAGLAQTGIDKLTGNENSLPAQQLNDFYSRDRLAAEQSPIAHRAGDFVGQAGMYAATNPIFDAGAKAVGVTSGLGKFAVNQLAQNAQDLALDTAPTYNQNISMGMSEDEAKKEALKGAIFNAGGNLLLGGAGELAGRVLPKLKNAGAAEEIADTVDDIPALQAQKEAAEAEIKRLSEQIPEAPKDIPEVPKVEASEIQTPQKVANSPVEAGVDNAPINSEVLPEVDVDRLTTEPQKVIDDVRERGFHESSRERGAIPDDIKEAMSQQDSIDRNTYSPQHNWETEDKAISLWNEAKTFDDAEKQFSELLKDFDPASTPYARRLVTAYSKAGNREAAMNVMDKLAEAGTKTGRFSQSMILGLAKDDPITALRYAERQIDKINEAGRKNFGNKWKDFSLSDEEKAMFDNIMPGDEEAIANAMNKIGERIGAEHPTKMIEKVLETRRLAMLFNLRTNIRNFLANPPTMGMRWTADRLDAIGQNIAHIINPDFKVTQAVTGSGIEGRKIAKEIFESKRVQDLLDGSVSKYEDTGIKDALLKNKTMYKGNFLEHWIDDVTGGGIEKIAKLLGKDIKVDGGIQALNKKAFGKSGVRSFLETWRNATYKLLDLGDSPYVKENFIERLGSYIHAQGIKDVKDVPEEAVQLAYEEAMKATYKDKSWGFKMMKGVRDMFNQIPVVGKPLGEAVAPFVQAPGNIAARMVDYSPIRGSKGVYDVIKGAQGSNENLVKQGIEEISKGLTGTAAIYAGMKLYESGLITGSASKDKDQRQFDKQSGFREWSLRIPGKNGGKDKYAAFDWAQPAAEPILIGALLQDAITKSDEYDSDLLKALGVEGSLAGKVIGAGKAGAGAAFNSWFNVGPLTGLRDFMGGGEYSNNYSDENGLSGMAKNLENVAVNSFVGSFVPAQLNAITKSMDPVQRNTTDPTNNTKTLLNQTISKIPVLSETLPAKYDTWGREMKIADTKGEAFVARNISPGELTTDTSSELDAEISRLGQISPSAFPPVASKKAGDKALDNKDISNLQKNMGERNYQLADAFMKSDAYKDMSDEDKIKTLSDLYSMSKSISNQELFGQEIKDSSDAKNAGIYKDLGADGFMEYLGAKRSLPDKGKDAAAVEMLSKMPEEKQDKLLPYLIDTEGSKEKAALWGKAGQDGSAFIKEYKASEAEKARKAEQKAKDDAAKNKKKEAAQKEAADKAGVSVQQLGDLRKQLAGYGAVDSDTTVKYYNHARQTIPSLTTKEYAETVRHIGGEDKKISQKEMLNYFNTNNLDADKVNEYWNAYGEWKRVPKLKNGKWVAR